MMNKLLIVVVLVILAVPVWADTGVVTVSSSVGFSDTLERFKAVLKEKGVKVVFELDHQANGKRVEESLNKTHLLLFGNPKLGTPLMRSVRSIGIDLPMKVLIWEDDDGKVFLTYNDPQYLAARHSIEDNKAIFRKMSAVLKVLTTTAAQKP
jgi:uncharacterized protein (DUF302 family)